MPEALTAILPLIQAGVGGAGLIGNIINGIQQGQQIDKLKAFENLSPEQLSAMVAKAEQPLSQSLLNAVGNRVQADVASRGLAESPGVFSTTESQALAPYQLQEQQNAMQLIMKKLGLPAETIAALRGSPPADVSSIFQRLAASKGTPSDPGLTPSDATSGLGIG